MITQTHCPFIKAVKIFLAQNFIKTMPHQTFLAILFLMRVGLIFALLVNVNDGYDVATISQPIILLILWSCLIYSIILLTSIVYIVTRIYYKPKGGKQKEQSYFYKMIEKLVVYSLVVFRVFLVIPIVFVCMVAIKVQQQGTSNQGYSAMVDALVVLNLMLGFGVAYLISAIGFWNKIGIRQNGLAYSTVVNLQSLTYLFIPIVIILRVFSWQIQAYIGIVYTVLSLIVIYIYPIVSFNHNKLHTVSTSCVISVVFVLSLLQLIDGRMNSFGKFVIILVSIIVGTLVMWQGQLSRMRGLLILQCKSSNDNMPFNNQQQQQHNNLGNSSLMINNNHNSYNMLTQIDYQSYYQNLLYHLINWNHTQSQLVLYAISTLNYTNQDTQLKQQQREINNNKNANFKNTHKGLILGQIIKSNVKENKSTPKKAGTMTVPRIETKQSVGKIQPTKMGTNQSLKMSRFNTGENQTYKSSKQTFKSSKQTFKSSKFSSAQKKQQQLQGQQVDDNQERQEQEELLMNPLQNIMSTLTQQEINLQKLYSLFGRLISSKLNTKCDLQMIESQRLGIGELMKVLQQSTGYFILLLQSLMLDSRNFSKTYLLIKLQQQLNKQAQTSSFIQSTYQLAIISIIQSHFIQQFKTNHLTYSHAQVYFSFQQQYQKLKKYIKLSIENKIVFWKETNKQQPMKNKLEDYVTKNYFLQTKILKHTQRLTATHPTSPVILISLIQAYNQLAMNTNISSSKNSFNFLAIEFHKMFAKTKGQPFKQSFLRKSTIMEGRDHSSLRENSTKIEVPYMPVESNPSHTQKGSIQQSNKQHDQQNANKYAIQKNIGVFLINLQTHQYPIEWANQYFLDNYTQQTKKLQDNNIQEKEQHVKKQLFLNDFIIPELRLKHDKFLHEFIQKGESLGFKHHQIEFYLPYDQTFVDVQIQFQYIPSLSEGLKMVGFVHSIKEHEEVVEIMVRNDLSFVASTKSFMNHYDEYCLVKQHINFEKDKEAAFELIMKNNIFGDFFANLRIKQANYGKKKKKQNEERQNQEAWFETKMNHLGLNYKVRLKRKIQYECKSMQGMKQSQSESSKMLFVFILQTQSIVEEKKKGESEIMKSTIVETKQFETKKSNKSILKKDSLEVMTDSLAHQQIDRSTRSIKFTESVRSSMRGSQDSFLIKGSKGSLYGKSAKNAEKDDMIMEDILIKERQKIQDKPVQIVNLQRCYEILVSQKTPRNVKRWRLFTAIILILLMAAMVFNMGFLAQRQNSYKTNNSLAVTYSQLISDICSTILAVREYNYYVTIYNTSMPEIPFIISKLVDLSNVISVEVNVLASLLRDTWQAYEILPTGQTVSVNDSSYVVISNYLLSSITFISQLSSSNMSFPILVSEIRSTNQMPTGAQISFLEAVFNGLYIAIPNLLVNRESFISSMANTLQSMSGFYFLYTCIAGSLSLVLFFILSMLLQLKSERIRSKTGGLLSSECLSGQEKIRKIYRLQRLSEILQKSRQTSLIQNLQEQQERYRYMDVIAKTLKNIQIEDAAHHEEGNMALNGAISQGQEHIIEDKTNREFMVNEETIRSNDIDSVDDHGSEDTEKGMKKGNLDNLQNYIKERTNTNIYKIENAGDTTLYVINYKDHLLLVTFYLIVCIPFFAYFIGILVGTFSVNSTIVNHIVINSQVENRKTYQEIVYLFTRETGYYESFLEANIANWSQNLMEIINETYINDRYVESLVMSQGTAVNLKNLLSQLNNNDLCQYISNFTTSTYYNITFTQGQCLNLAKSMMNQGYKQLVVSFLQSSLQLISNYSTPATLNDSQRVQYLQQPQLASMKSMLAYSEQFVAQMASAAQSDFQVQLYYLNEISILLSMISIFSLIVFILVVSYRYKRLRFQRRQVLSVINLISVRTISSSINNKDQNQNSHSTQLLKNVQAIDWNFYE